LNWLSDRGLNTFLNLGVDLLRCLPGNFSWHSVCFSSHKHTSMQTVVKQKGVPKGAVLVTLAKPSNHRLEAALEAE
jgi:hypothetical protein